MSLRSTARLGIGMSQGRPRIMGEVQRRRVKRTLRLLKAEIREERRRRRQRGQMELAV